MTVSAPTHMIAITHAAVHCIALDPACTLAFDLGGVSVSNKCFLSCSLDKAGAGGLQTGECHMEAPGKTGCVQGTPSPYRLIAVRGSGGCAWDWL